MGRARKHGYLVSPCGELLRQAGDHDGIARELGGVLDAVDQQTQGIFVARAWGVWLRLDPPFLPDWLDPTACYGGRRYDLLEKPVYLFRPLLPGKLRGARHRPA